MTSTTDGQATKRQVTDRQAIAPPSQPSQFLAVSAGWLQDSCSTAAHANPCGGLLARYCHCVMRCAPPRGKVVVLHGAGVDGKRTAVPGWAEPGSIPPQKKDSTNHTRS
jgi:hypothetical protein